MTRTWTLTLDDFPPPKLARALSPNGRAHWATQKRAKDLVKLLTSIQAKDAPRFTGRVILKPVLTYPVARRRDDDNAGFVKYCRDQLVRDGVLVADDTDHVRQEPVAVRVERGVRRFELTIEEVAG